MKSWVFARIARLPRHRDGGAQRRALPPWPAILSESLYWCGLIVWLRFRYQDQADDRYAEHHMWQPRIEHFVAKAEQPGRDGQKQGGREVYDQMVRHGQHLEQPPLVLGQQAVGDQDDAHDTRNHDRRAADMLEPKNHRR